MAKQKIATAQEGELPVIEGAETGEVTPATTQDANAAPIGETNAFISSILKNYPDHGFLYIDKQGGVFLEGTNQKLIGDAILYRNPYKQ